MFKVSKDPNSTLDYVINWANWLAEGDTISSSTWIVPSGLLLEASAFDDTRAVGWISGGTLGSTYTVINRIETSAGRKEDASLQFLIKDH